MCYTDSQKKVLAEALIPNIDYEMERISNPREYIEENEIDYKSMLMCFGASSRNFKEKKDVIDERSDNFFFGIYGLGDVLFEIDSKTGLLYANRIYPNRKHDQVERYLANDYIRKYEGEVKIRELARGYYEDIDNLGSLLEQPCENTDIASKKVIIRVKKID